MSAGAEADLEVTHAIWRESTAPITVARNLIEFIQQTCKPWKGRPIERNTKSGEADFLIAMGFGRAVRTCKAAIDLVALGFAEEALMLARSLYEGMLVAYWVDQNEAEAAVRFQESMDLSNHFTAELTLKMGWIDEAEAVDHLLEPKELERLKREYGKYGQNLWTKPSEIYSLAEDIAASQPESDRIDLDGFRRFALKVSNQTLHATPYSHLDTILGDDGDGYRLKFGAVSLGQDFTEPPLFSACWCLSNHAELVFGRFEFPELGEFKEKQRRTLDVFKTVLDEEAAGVGRNDPCPCGSGTKFKRCHEGRTKP